MSSRFYQNPISRSFFMHGLLLLLTLIYLNYFSKPISVSEPIEVSFNDPIEENKSKKAVDSKKTVVKKSEGEEAKEAKINSYLSDKTRVVKVEQASRFSGEIAAKKALARKVKDESSSSPTKPVQLSDLGLKILNQQKAPFSKQRNWADSQTGEAIPGGQYIQGMKEGETSALNTKEFVFFSYFDRVRKQLDQAWQPILRANIQKIFRTGRRLATNSDFVTRTLVTLNAKGEISKVQLLEESGTTDLDQAAVEALNKAGPYPNPPKGLVDESGIVQIRWDFILKT